VNATTTDERPVSDGTREALGPGDSGHKSCRQRCGSLLNVVCLYWKGCKKEVITVLLTIVVGSILGAIFVAIAFVFCASSLCCTMIAARSTHRQMHGPHAVCCGCQALRRGYLTQCMFRGCGDATAPFQSEARHVRERRGTYIESRGSRSWDEERGEAITAIHRDNKRRSKQQHRGSSSMEHRSKRAASPKRNRSSQETHGTKPPSGDSHRHRSRSPGARREKISRRDDHRKHSRPRSRSRQGSGYEVLV
jgi:hypothetical protein